MPARSCVYSILRARLNLSPLDSSHLPRLRERQALCSGFPRGGTFLGEASLGQITPRCNKSWWFGHAGLKARKQSKVLPGRFQMKRRRPRKSTSGGSKMMAKSSSREVKMASSKPLGDRLAPAGRQDRSETVSGQLSERSWRLLGPSRGAQGAFWDRLGPSRRSPGALGRLP